MQSHNLGKKSSKRKRGFRKDHPVHPADTRAVRKMFGRRLGR
jgi:ribosomal protein L35